MIFYTSPQNCAVGWNTSQYWYLLSCCWETRTHGVIGCRVVSDKFNIHARQRSRSWTCICAKRQKKKKISSGGTHCVTQVATAQKSCSVWRLQQPWKYSTVVARKRSGTQVFFFSFSSVCSLLRGGRGSLKTDTAVLPCRLMRRLGLWNRRQRLQKIVLAINQRLVVYYLTAFINVTSLRDSYWVKGFVKDMESIGMPTYGQWGK